MILECGQQSVKRALVASASFPPLLPPSHSHTSVFLSSPHCPSLLCLLQNTGYGGLGSCNFGPDWKIQRDWGKVKGAGMGEGEGRGGSGRVDSYIVCAMLAQLMRSLTAS